ncbi:NnrU family protein [Pedomonas sp. V897]|uniref:NnrU family protein n=1 Tax=Pedomonas sp. V897 TaxID=3446482 RepID=UPI003EDEF184
MTQLVMALLAFVGSHFLLSHPLRQPLIRAAGQRGFLGIYTLVAFGTLAWVILAYSKAPVVYLWEPPAFSHPLAAVLMLVALVLFVGSLLQPSPASVRMDGPHGEAAAPPSRLGEAPRGVVAITRHPMMWAFALWAFSHALANGDAATVFLCLGIGILALVGAALQDRRKAVEFGPAWQGFAAATAYLPFAAQLSGRLSWRSAWPGWLVTVGGISLFVVLLYFHEVLFGVKVFAP